jgi:uncharacterized protein
MNTKKIWANLGVTDLERTTRFYTELGFEHNGASEDLTSFLVGEHEFVIHFFLKHVLEANVGVGMADPKDGKEIIFTLSADSKEEVDRWEDEVRKAGGTVVSGAEEFGAGYYGFVFADPDGHTFNVFFM